jgi:hypothetical protein
MIPRSGRVASACIAACTLDRLRLGLSEDLCERRWELIVADRSRSVKWGFGWGMTLLELTDYGKLTYRTMFTGIILQVVNHPTSDHHDDRARGYTKREAKDLSRH